MNLELTINTLETILDAKIFQRENLPENFAVKNVIIDTRNPILSNQTLFVALAGAKENGQKYLEDFQRKGGLVALVENYNERIKLCQIICPNALDALQKIAQHHRSKFIYPVIAITGSNGKTIVKEWLYHVLKDKFSIVRSPKSYNSQIGVALSVLEMTDKDNLAIFEAGISKPGEMIKLKNIIQPTLGIFTGIGDAHSSNFKSLDEKRAEKLKLFEDVDGTVFYEENLKIELPYSDEASQINGSLVFSMAQKLGLSQNEILSGLKTVPAVSMRLEQIEGKNNCTLLNDTYSADLLSFGIAIKQLQSLNQHQKKILFLTALEDNDKDVVKNELEKILNAAEFDELVFIGEKKYLPVSKTATSHYESVTEFLNQKITYSDASILIKGSRKYALEKIVQRLSVRKHVTRLTINFASLRKNLIFFRSKLSPSTKILAMVKAQSYGGGLLEIAEFLVKEKVDYFGVAYADEGILLRKAGIKLPILVMNPEHSAFDDIIDYDLEPSIYSPEILMNFLNYLVLRQITNFPIHIKLDTGMNRLGFEEQQLNQLCDTLQTQPEVYVKSVFSHLSVADDDSENEFTNKQIRSFNISSGLIADRLGYKFDCHIANSAGTLNYGRTEFDMVRLGIGLFGLVDKKNKELENVLSLSTQISQIKTVKAGESVGYGRTYIATHDHRIGIIPVGYADGLRRGLSQGNWQVIINGKKAPIVGNICMDMCMINLEGINAKTGDDVLIFGDDNSIFDMATNLKTIPYEIIGGISSRVHRVYIDE